MSVQLDTGKATFRAWIHKHTLIFKGPAGTSHGTLTEKPVYYLFLRDTTSQTSGIGECSTLSYLSPEHRPGYEAELHQLAATISEGRSLAEGYQAFSGYPSVQFGLEQAYRDWLLGGKRLLFDTPFSRGEAAIPINGLIWMNQAPVMRQAMDEKIAAGFNCLKLKIGALDWDQELGLIRNVRQQYRADELEIRVDANGAFGKEEAFRKLDQLARYQVHSIEHPLPKGETDATARLCREAPLPVALDEELIGYTGSADKAALLDHIQPAYIILKPSLVGGFQHADEWIRLANERNIGWWATSALESNIGLNAIAQWTATYPVTRHQGLGTGGLYTNNIPAPLYIEQAQLRYRPGEQWDLSALPG